MTEAKKNQRYHYRITDIVRIGLQQVPEEIEQDVIEDITQGLMHSSLARINSDIDLALANIPNQHKSTQIALKALNVKLDMLAGAMGLHAAGVLEEQAVNLGFGGCRFRTEKDLNKDEAVDLSIVLTGNQRLRIFARVVDVKALAGRNLGEREVALQFQAMGKTTSTILERHLVQRQRLALRTRLRR